MKIVVTGASGFLGRFVVRRLVSTAATVVPVSRRLMPGVVQVSDYTETPTGDVLIHLAEAADRGNAERLGSIYEVEVFAGLSALLKKPYQHVIYASSAVLYGDHAQTPRNPRDTVFVNDAYTRVKHRAESAVLNSAGGIVARLSNLFGPGMSEGNVMRTILRQIPGVGPIRVRDTASVRDFLWVEDAADAIAKMAVGGKGHGVFNVGTGVGHSIGEVARVALGLAGQPDRGVVAMEPGQRASHLVLDVSDTVSRWRWSPVTLLEDGINSLLSATRAPIS